MTFLNIGIRLVELALDGNPCVVIGAPGNEVDAGVLFTAVELSIAPTADFRELLLGDGIGSKVVDH